MLNGNGSLARTRFFLRKNRLFIPAKFFRLFRNRRAFVVFSALSTLLGFWTIFTMDEYLPWRVRFSKGVFWAVVLNAGLWLVALNMRGKLRYLVALLLLPTIYGAYQIWGNCHILIGYAVVAWLLAILIQVLRGDPLD